jgi:octopine/nopaline transport system substrate-binding protein
MNMKNYLPICSLAFAVLLVGPAMANDWKSATIATEGAYAPWNLTNPDGSLDGFEPELAKILCERAKVECTLVASDWDGMFPAINAGKFDLIMDAVGVTEERKKVVDFTVPYAATPAGFAAPKDSSLVNVGGTGATIKMAPGQTGVEEIAILRDAFKGKTIGIQTATVYAKFIHDNFGDIADIREYKTSAERDIDLQNGRIDLGFDDAIYFSGVFEAMKGELVFTGPTIAGSIWGDGIALAVRKSDPELRDKFNEAIKSALADGTVKTLSMKWFKADVSPK